ncbi:MAG: hypothetical protein A4E65_03026 [Syntrophorhabdus sp. PtaU1.Bin153]|nr:MAG: hypothetical protein A4E65_03026 [Syntrophorhabdus sp. PtaU1.Bin153]
MKRDMELIRSILKEIEACNDHYGLERAPQIEGHTEGEIAYHMKLLLEAGLIKALVNDYEEVPEFLSINLTWTGQDFLSAAKDESIWQKAKESVLKPGAAFTFDLLVAYLKAKVAEKLGIELP